MPFDIVIIRPKPLPILIILSFHGVTTLAPKAKKISLMARYAMNAFTLMNHVLNYRYLLLLRMKESILKKIAFATDD
jgi:hypothetical protein